MEFLLRSKKQSPEIGFHQRQIQLGTDFDEENSFTSTFWRLRSYDASQNRFSNSTAADICNLISNVDRDNVSQMSDIIQQEYIDAVENFDLEEFLSQREPPSVMYGFESLPPSAVKSLKFKTPAPMKPDDFQLLLQYYNFCYTSAKYIGINHGMAPSTLASLGYIQVNNSIARFVSFSLFYNAYKSTESSAKNHRGSFVLAFSRSKNKLCPAQVQYFFRHDVSVLDENHQHFVITHTLAKVKWFKPAPVDLPSFQTAADYMELCSCDFEEDSAMSILPVHYIRSPIAIKLDYIDNMNAFVKMPEQLLI